ncbi:MAG: hypothetical protein LBP50_03035 [Tannerella sp.]|jgi:hypothetical protein|nr:hypothetical protein [Tannerella sp.]
MSRENKLKLPDEQFLAYANTINSQCTQHAAEWEIDSARLSNLNTLTTRANQAYAANRDRETRNRITSANKKAAFGELKHFLSPFVDYLESNLSVPDTALAIMDLRSRVHHASLPIGRPDESPVVSVVHRHDEMTVYVALAEFGHPTQSITRHKYHGFKLRWKFEDESSYRFEFSTRLRFTLRFDRADEARRVILAAAWINPRLQEGPWSKDLTEIVS